MLPSYVTNVGCKTPTNDDVRRASTPVSETDLNATASHNPRIHFSLWAVVAQFKATLLRHNTSPRYFFQQIDRWITRLSRLKQQETVLIVGVPINIIWNAILTRDSVALVHVIGNGITDNQSPYLCYLKTLRPRLGTSLWLRDDCPASQGFAWMKWTICAFHWWVPTPKQYNPLDKEHSSKPSIPKSFVRSE